MGLEQLCESYGRTAVSDMWLGEQNLPLVLAELRSRGPISPDCIYVAKEEMRTSNEDMLMFYQATRRAPPPVIVTIPTPAPVFSPGMTCDSFTQGNTTQTNCH